MAINPTISRSQLDDQLKVCDEQALPTGDANADVSGSAIDTLVTNPTVNVGNRAYFKVKVTTAFAGADAVAQIRPIASASADLSSPVDLSNGIEIPTASGTLGAIFDVPIPVGSVNTKLRYIGVSLQNEGHASHAFSAGKVSVWLATD